MNQNRILETVPSAGKTGSSEPNESVVRMLKYFKGHSVVPPLEQLIDRAFSPDEKGMVDILLIFPPATVAERYGKESVGNSGGDLPPLGITYVASYLREKGLGVGLLDCCALEIDIEKILQIIEERKPRSIGISATTFGYPKGVRLAQKIKEQFPEKLIILGGAHANAVPTEPMESHDCFDIVAFEEGEITSHEILTEFAKHNWDAKKFLADADSLQSIKGIVFRVDGEIIKTEDREIFTDLDFLPLPARDLLPFEKYIPLPNQYKVTPLAHMVVIRGCPYFCTFCDQANTTARMTSPKRVVEEIKIMVEAYGVREISFWDDTMTYHRKWMTDFCQRLADEKLDIVWSCYAAVQTMDQEILHLMKRAGCWNIFFGFESGDAELLKNMKAHHKNKSPEKIMEVAQWTKDAGIEIRASFMIAVPGETPEKAGEMIQFAIDLDPEYAQFSITTPYPGTKLYDEIKEGKWGKLTTEDFSEYHMWNVVFLPEGYKDKEEVQAMERKAFRKFYLRPRYILKKIIAIRSFEDIRRYWKGLILVLIGFVFKESEQSC